MSINNTASGNNSFKASTRHLKIDVVVCEATLDNQNDKKLCVLKLDTLKLNGIESYIIDNTR